MKYVTQFDRFEIGDFPMVCARSGLPATKMVRVQAYRSSTWPWFFFPGVTFVAALFVANLDHPWGLLPFAEGHVRNVSAIYDTGTGTVTLKGVGPDFVAATRSAQGKDI